MQNDSNGSIAVAVGRCIGVMRAKHSSAGAERSDDLDVLLWARGPVSSEKSCLVSGY